MNSYYTHNREELFNFIPNNCKSILDIGCSTGEFGKLLKSKNNKLIIWGVEPVENAFKIAKRNLDHVINDYFSEKLIFNNFTFDVITFNDSLEHFPDPEPPLKLAKKLLSKNGLIIVSIPNFRYIENIKHIIIEKDFKYVEAGILDKTHLRFFTLKSIQRLFNHLELEILSMNGINPHWWSGWKYLLLDLFFKEYVQDMKFQQYVIVAKNIDN
jgi:2-polyprenyl-3-methyl-5-hydroxy-6-metoxy-1,4-benzoquinol methylase